MPISIFPLNEIIFTDKRKGVQYILKTAVYSEFKGKKYLLLKILELLTFEQLNSAGWYNQKHLNF